MERGRARGAHLATCRLISVLQVAATLTMALPELRLQFDNCSLDFLVGYGRRLRERLGVE